MPRRSVLQVRRSAHQFPNDQTQSAAVSDPVIRTHDDERKRISRELHDEIGQGLMALRLSLGTLVKLSEASPDRIKAQEALDILDDTIEGLRRIIARLSPRVLEDLGLLGAIRREAELLSSQTGMRSQVNLPNHMSYLDQATELAIYRAVQEALHNISKHSGGRNFTVMLTRSAEQLKLRIEDDGEGFPEMFREEGFGVLGMRERIEELGGTLRIDSARNKGTQIQIEIPVNDAPLLRSQGHVRSLSGKAS